jgi:hypothetical protein
MLAPESLSYRFACRCTQVAGFLLFFACCSSTAQSQTIELPSSRVEADWLQQFQLRSSRPGAAMDASAVQSEIRRARGLANRLQNASVDTGPQCEKIAQLERQWLDNSPPSSADQVREAYLRVRWIARELTLLDPQLDFQQLVFALRAPGSYAHMSDQYFGWFSRPGGGLYVLDGWKSSRQTLRSLTAGLPEGSVMRPDLSFDAARVLFAYCRYYPEVHKVQNKLDKSAIPDDAFYHLYEVNLDGSGLRRLTFGKYDHFSGRYLPDGRIVLVSTRRGRAIQCSGNETPDSACDGYMRCGGSEDRPVPVFTLHIMDGDGRNMRCLSASEGFEWDPTVADDGRIMYSRWDYVDRDSLPFVSLWTTWPDGSAAQALFGNFIANPMGMFEARQIPASRDIIFTAAAQHAVIGGSLVRLDSRRGPEAADAMTRMTPEVPWPESEGWPTNYFAAPYPLTQEYSLVAWSNQGLASEFDQQPGRDAPTNALGIYLFDNSGSLELIHRDDQLCSTDAVPVQARKRPPLPSTISRHNTAGEGRMVLVDVNRGLEPLPAGTIRRLRIVGVPPKTQPVINFPSIGLTDEDPGKFVLGTVPVESDGSAYFRVPADVPLFFQALDERGMSVQTMRSVAYVPSGKTYTCIGCHERRETAPPNQPVRALSRPPDRITPGPEGSWPFDFNELVQPVLDRQCVRCHKPGTDGGQFDLSPGNSYTTLIAYGPRGTLQSMVVKRHATGRSLADTEGARHSPLVQFLRRKHYDVQLTDEELECLVTWMDLYSQRSGSFSAEQANELRELRKAWKPLLNDTE